MGSKFGRTPRSFPGQGPEGDFGDEGWAAGLGQERGSWEAAGGQGPGRRGGRPRSDALSFSDLAGVPRLGLSLINLLVFHVSVGCLLSNGEKDVKLIPTLIKTASRLNMYEHILIWGLNRKEN